MDNEMTLNEFMLLVKASDNKNGSWNVELPLKDGTTGNVTVDKCSDEFDAKERAFLYLLERIHKK